MTHYQLIQQEFLHLGLLLYPTFYNFYTKFSNINEHSDSAGANKYFQEYNEDAINYPLAIFLSNVLLGQLWPSLLNL